MLINFVAFIKWEKYKNTHKKTSTELNFNSTSKSGCAMLGTDPPFLSKMIFSSSRKQSKNLFSDSHFIWRTEQSAEPSGLMESTMIEQKY